MSNFPGHEYIVNDMEHALITDNSIKDLSEK